MAVLYFHVNIRRDVLISHPPDGSGRGVGKGSVLSGGFLVPSRTKEPRHCELRLGRGVLNGVFSFCFFSGGRVPDDEVPNRGRERKPRTDKGVRTRE